MGSKVLFYAPFHRIQKYKLKRIEFYCVTIVFLLVQHVCDDSFEQVDADVACRDMGYGDNAVATYSMFENKVYFHLFAISFLFGRIRSYA